MTVEELIEELSKCDKGMKVYILKDGKFEDLIVTCPLIATQDDDGITVSEERAILIL